MNKKDLKFIIAVALVALLGFIGYKVWQANFKPVTGVVMLHNTEILSFDVNENRNYEFNGDYGRMNLEVKDGKFRVFDVECPNHNCESMGWVGVDDLLPIVCMPNGVIIYAEE